MTSDLRIPALTICQPWAWLIADGIKRVENRSWETRYRGALWIHAGKSRKMLAVAGELRDAGFDVPDDLEFGAIVARVQVVDCVPYDEARLFGDLRSDPFASGPYCWVLTRVERLPRPVECVGALSLWQPGDEVRRECEEQLV
jgi:hypothetical protein